MDDVACIKQKKKKQYTKHGTIWRNHKGFSITWMNKHMPFGANNPWLGWSVSFPP